MSRKHDFTIYQGSTFSKTVTYKPGGVVADLTGYSVSFIANQTGTTVINLSVGNGITVTPLEGKIVISLDAQETSDLNFSKASYELKLILGGYVSPPILKGKIVLEREEKVISP